ncbi:MAG: ACP S-malonyltransferase [Clostridia bacterium]|nr:ACP S-malonyltransferase [Clostridia bacterium]
MTKIAIVFPGQGAQHVGMGQDFSEQYTEAKAVFEAASEAMGYSMEDLCFNSSAEELKKTENTQPSILTASYAMYKVLEAKGVKAEAFAGLSLGEYTAHVAAGTMPFEAAVKVVRKRGQYMQEEVPMGVGTMAAILGLSREAVEDACEKASTVGVVEPANYNCPKQLVIAGEVNAVEQAVENCKEAGAKKAVLLPVSAPFHTSMLIGAGEKLSKELENVTYGAFDKPVVSNVTALYYPDSASINELLVRQVSSPVKWEDSVQQLIDDGFDTFIEVGPGDALTKFGKRISKDLNLFTVNSVESMEKTLEALGL